MSTNNLAPGMSGIALDIFVKAGSTLYDPADTPVFEIKDDGGFQQGSGFYYGHRVAIGHYDARNYLIDGSTSGTLGDWTITWTVGTSTKIETFSVAAASLSIGGDSVNDIDQIYENIRIDIGDLSGDIFNDSMLERYLIKSVMRLNRALGIASGRVRPTGIVKGGLGTPASIGAIVLDLDARTIRPDNHEIHDILVLQAEVLITRAEMSVLRRASAASAGQPGAEMLAAASGIVSGAGDGVMVKNADGVVIDTKGRYSAWMNNRTKLFLDEAKRREEELEKAIKDLKHSFSSSMGKVVY
jgi:hypothetical protein